MLCTKRKAIQHTEEKWGAVVGTKILEGGGWGWYKAGGAYPPYEEKECW